jgi:hypothetical protein
MREQRTPTLFRDLGTVARLYGTVFWMFGQRLLRGPRWDEKLTEEALHVREGRFRKMTRMVRHHN